MKKKVVIGMSGGVDSSVAAYLLKEQGYEVIGIMMKLSPDDPDYVENEGGCCSLSAANDARRVADVIDIPFYVMNFKKSFKENVIDNFISEYLGGKTPNPCVVCNKTIKFNEFLRKAQALGADYIATGHYAEVIEKNGRYLLKRSEDERKDQTYMLYNLTQDQLAHILMPCGKYEKTEIRSIAEKIGLDVFRKKDSQEICFIPDNNHGEFIKKSVEKNKVKPGNFVDKNGQILGKHKGIVYYTIGQRKGLGLALGKPVFVTDIIPEKNQVVIGDEEEIFKTELIAKDVNLIYMDELKEPMEVLGKVRYSAKLSPATIYPLENGKLKAVFREKQRAITKGQSVVFYKDNFVVGGGIIEEIL
ncbi:tRNA 2-thiouridine(34) synthase MnmA [Hathewaya limosa]|uniref:tRNA-specific 2-thiouridylase MnmA n=1 Tax=Hathewaya limosa TaxID=1536 RepID=A0ABU0JRR2_HATLI|nr:tRNA 2-thiouridine(34) synthase MnmA [Hathewaya limosa]MDQ0478946.1 tRNA-specific 2-thiouridylase [Hathewaya limosa]